MSDLSGRTARVLATAAVTALAVAAPAFAPPAHAAPGAVHIRDIQGRSHVSPLAGQTVEGVTGVVTAVSKTGFWVQDPRPDNNTATGEAILVFTRTAPTVAVGNAVTVGGKVAEYRPGNTATNLTTTEIDAPTVTVTAAKAPVAPRPTVLGIGGRMAPRAVRSDSPGDVEQAKTFDPRRNALDFYESLEGMLVRLPAPTAVGPTTSHQEIAVLPSGFGNPRTARGGIRYTYEDANAERLILDDTLAKLPAVNVRDRFAGNVDGILNYDFGNFKVSPLATPKAISGGLKREVAKKAGTGELAAATFNVENLSPKDKPEKFARLAQTVVTNLAAPDLLAIEEIQDDNGTAAGGGSVVAEKTWTQLIAAIKAAGGPAYQFRQIDPRYDQDGGAPHGNIRQGFLFRTDRGLTFTDRAGGTATAANAVERSGGKPSLKFSPGRIDPTNEAFTTSRKPLAGEFSYRGKPIFVVANHLNSKGGDQPLFGRFQPPTRSSETQRHGQAQALRTFVDQILAVDRNASVLVLGDLNDFEFSTTANILTAGGRLIDLPRTLPAFERYSYVFDGNSQILDHILASPGVRRSPLGYDIVHVNSEYADQVSDHDPQVVRFR